MSNIRCSDVSVCVWLPATGGLQQVLLAWPIGSPTYITISVSLCVCLSLSLSLCDGDIFVYYGSVCMYVRVRGRYICVLW